MLNALGDCLDIVYPDEDITKQRRKEWNSFPKVFKIYIFHFDLHSQ